MMAMWITDGDKDRVERDVMDALGCCDKSDVFLSGHTLSDGTLAEDITLPASGEHCLVRIEHSKTGEEAFSIKSMGLEVVLTPHFITRYVQRSGLSFVAGVREMVTFFLRNRHFSLYECHSKRFDPFFCFSDGIGFGVMETPSRYVLKSYIPPRMFNDGQRRVWQTTMKEGHKVAVSFEPLYSKE